MNKIIESFKFLLLPFSEIKDDPQDSQYWRVIRDNKLRTLKDLFSSNQVSPNELCIPESGHTFLDQSIIFNRKEMFKLCLLYHADVNTKDKNDCTPLMKAVALGRIPMIEELLQKGADPYLKDKLGQNCFDKAIILDRINSLNALSSHVGQQSSNNINIQQTQQNIFIDENEKL